MPWVETTEPKGKWVEVPEQPMDKLIRSSDISKHFQRIPEVYQEQVQSGLRGMKEGNVLQKGLGALQYVTAPLNAPIRAMVGEPVQSLAEQAGVPRKIAEPLGMAAEVGVGFVPIQGTSMLSQVAQMAGVGQKYGGLPTRVQKMTPETWKEFGEVPNAPLTDLAAQYYRPKPVETRSLSELMDEAIKAKLPATPSDFEFGRMPLKGIFTEKLYNSVDAFNEAIARLKIPKTRDVTTDEILSVWRNVEDNNTELQSYIKGLSDREKITLAKNAMKGEIPKGFGFKYKERPYQEFTLRPESEEGMTSNLPKVQYPISIRTPINKQTQPPAGETFSLTPEVVTEAKVKPTQKDMFGVGGEFPIRGGIPSKEMGETPLERATAEAAERSFIKKHQLDIPISEGNMSLEDRVNLLERAGQKEAAQKLKQKVQPKKYQPENIITWIKSKGGIDYQKEFWNGELDMAMENQPFLKSALNKRSGKGLTLDELSMMAKSDGWIKEATPQALLDAINKKKLSPEVVESRMARGRFGGQGGFVDLTPIYNRIMKPEGPRFAKEKSSAWKDIKLKADELAGIISTRVGNIAPELKGRLRKYVFDEGLSTTEDLRGIEPFYKKFNKLDEPTQFKLTEMLSNGKIQDAEQIFQQKGMLFEFRKAEKVKDSLWSRAKESGIEAGDLPNHFPRRVKNYEELKSQLGNELKTQVDKAIDEIQKKQGRVLTIEEKGSIADSVLRGYNPGGLPIGAPSFAKERKIPQLTPELTQHYYPAHDTLRQYVESLNSKVAQNKFFGKDLKNVADETLAKMGLGTQTDLEASIGTTLERLKAEGNNLTPDQETQLKNMLSAVFNPKMTGRATQMTKDITYASTLTNIGPALTQVQDLALALEKEGLFNTVRGIAKSISGKGISIQDLGIENIAQEMNQSKSAVNWLLREGLKWSGFRSIDKLGKETVINGALSKYQKMASKDPQKLNKILDVVFGKEAPKVAQDLLNKNITGDVKFLLFNELSDLQPISKIEVPEKYLRSDSGKIFYALKTYQLKLFDIYRNDIFKKIKEGNVKEGLGRLGRLTASLVLLGAGVDQVKDFVFGRKTNFDDLVIDNFLKIGGMSKYTTWQARREGIPKAIINTLAPPMGVATDVGKDINKLWNEYISSDVKKFQSASKKGFETTKNIPIVGKPYYWWLGEGSRKEINRQRKGNY